jgi:hypothetical protein
MWTMGGAANIPYPAISCWLDDNLVWDDDDRAEYLYLIQRLDTAYVEHLNKKK